MLAHTEANKRTESSTFSYPHLFFSILTKQPELGILIAPLQSFTQIYYNAHIRNSKGDGWGHTPRVHDFKMHI